ncbi:MerR family transcriptional regulator [Cohnella phaseoli]|uniref:MerR family transcriptional regulator n=1 Tax=Cohnella phaseoli TaxID=456490 RepID=UPI000E27E185|nr:MerR family transcriptional regulator [Cohnella phaseoli]
MECLTIGQLSHQTGVSRKAIRLYEDTGLVVPEVQRSNGNYRVYNENHVFCINCIKQFQSLGISLEEIKQLLVIFEKNTKDVEPHLQHLLREKLIRIDEHIEELQMLRQHVASFLDCPEEVFTHMEGI